MSLLKFILIEGIVGFKMLENHSFLSLNTRKTDTLLVKNIIKWNCVIWTYYVKQKIVRQTNTLLLAATDSEYENFHLLTKYSN